MRDYLIFLSASQIFKTGSYELSVDKFAEATGYSSYYVSFTMLMDHFWGRSGLGVSYIDDYKIGKITTIEFYDGIRYRLSKTKEELADETIQDCWNAMCQFPETAKTEIVNIINLLGDKANNNFHLICITETNQLQHEYNMEQFHALLTEEQKQIATNQIHFINSFEKGIADKMQLAKIGYDEISNGSTKYIISLHYHMPAEEIPEQGKFAEMVSNYQYHNIRTNSDTKMNSAIEIVYSDLAKDTVNHLFAKRR